MRIPNPMYIANNAASISFAISRLIIFIADSKIIVPMRPTSEPAMPAATFSVLVLGMGYRSLLMTLPEWMSVLDFSPYRWVGRYGLDYASGVHNRFRKYSRHAAGREGWS